MSEPVRFKASDGVELGGAAFDAGEPKAIAVVAPAMAVLHRMNRAFAGNLAMGVLFGLLFLRWRRTWPFAAAHFLLDASAGIGFILFMHHLPGFS